MRYSTVLVLAAQYAALGPETIAVPLVHVHCLTTSRPLQSSVSDHHRIRLQPELSSERYLRSTLEGLVPQWTDLLVSKVYDCPCQKGIQVGCSISCTIQAIRYL